MPEITLGRTVGIVKEVVALPPPDEPITEVVVSVFWRDEYGDIPKVGDLMELTDA